MHKAGYELKEQEGNNSGTWVLLDYGDIIIHILTEKTVHSIIWRESGVMEKTLR